MYAVSQDYIEAMHRCLGPAKIVIEQSLLEITFISSQRNSVFSDTVF